MNAYIVRSGGVIIAIDDAANVCGNAGSVAGSMAEAGEFADYYHKQKVSVEICSEAGKGSKRAQAAIALFDARDEGYEDLLLAMRRAGRGYQGATVGAEVSNG